MEEQRSWGKFAGKLISVHYFGGNDPRLAKTLKSAMEWGFGKLSQIIPEPYDEFYEAVIEELMARRVRIEEVLPIVTDLPGNPRFEIAGRFSLEEVQSGKVLLRGNNAFRPTNASAEKFTQILIAAFRELAQKRPEGA